MILKVGLTGGIGSGKSTVARIFEVLNIPVYYADTAARRLMNDDPLLRKQIIALFGEAAYTSGGLDRSYIASLVFNDPEKLGRLNAIVHPATIRDSDTWALAQTTPYIIKEAALIFETAVSQSLDFIIGVNAPSWLRIRRVVERDGISAGQVEKRMMNQMPEAEKMQLCDAVILNDEEHLIVPQVLHLHQRLLEMAQKKQPGKA